MFEYTKKSLSLVTKKFKRKVPLFILSYLVLSLLDSIGIALVFPVIVVLIDPIYIEKFSTYQKYSHLFPNGSIQSITSFLPFIMVIAFIIKNIAYIFISRWQIYFINNECSKSSIGVFRRYVRMPYLDSLNRDTGFMNFSILSASGLFYNSYLTPLFQLISDFITVFFLLVLLVSVDVKTAFIALLVNFIFGSLIFFLTKNKLKQIGRENQYFSERLVRIIKDVFSSFKEFKVLGRENLFENIFIKNRENTNTNQSRQMTFLMINKNSIEILFLFAIGIIAFLIISQNSKAVAFAQLSLYAMIMIRLMPSISRIFSSLQTMKTAESSIDLLYEEQTHFGKAQNIPKIPEPNELSIRESFSSKASIHFKDVCFSYPDSQSNTLHNLSFDIAPCTAIGIVGRTGSGKTTLVDIILGLIYPSSGKVFINNRHLDEILPEWKKHLGYVPQKISFMNATLLENIAYGIPKNEIDHTRIKEVIQIAQLEKDIASFDDGLETIIKEDGGNLSGGQKQRIGIARSLYSRPSILILDEATSALDVETESKIAEAINEIKEHCTLIIIAHRLSTIRRCDNIFYIDQGKLLAQGTFDSLSTHNSQFKHIVKLSSLSSNKVSDELPHTFN